MDSPRPRRVASVVGPAQSRMLAAIAAQAMLTQFHESMEQLTMSPSDQAVYRASRHRATVAQRFLPKPKGRGKLLRSVGLGGLRARTAFYQAHGNRPLESLLHDVFGHDGSQATYGALA